jgi:hypothetical protein
LAEDLKVAMPFGMGSDEEDHAEGDAQRPGHALETGKDTFIVWHERILHSAG